MGAVAVSMGSPPAPIRGSRDRRSSFLVRLAISNYPRVVSRMAIASAPIPARSYRGIREPSSGVPIRLARGGAGDRSGSVTSLHLGRIIDKD